MTPTDHSDYAERAHAKMLTENLLAASQLWRNAVIACSDQETKARCRASADECDDAVAVDAELEALAQKTLGIPTLAERGLDRLDFHEIGVSGLRSLLRRAYLAGRESRG